MRANEGAALGNLGSAMPGLCRFDKAISTAAC
jgi:hypothetical protein